MIKIPLLPWDSRHLHGIIRIPYPESAETILKEVGSLKKPYGLLPPYKLHDSTFTARCAGVMRDKAEGKVPPLDIYVAISGRQPQDLEDFIRALYHEGFRRFVLPANTGKYPLVVVLPFLSNHGIMKDCFYHVAGIPLEWNVGTWSWSEEEL